LSYQFWSALVAPEMSGVRHYRLSENRMPADLRYLLASLAATAAFAFLPLAFPIISRLFTTTAAIAFFGLTLYFLWPEIWNLHETRQNRGVALVGMIVCAVSLAVKSSSGTQYPKSKACSPC
jgi:hypothetical protein